MASPEGDEPRHPAVNSSTVSPRASPRIAVRVGAQGEIGLAATGADRLGFGRGRGQDVGGDPFLVDSITRPTAPAS